MQISFEEVEFWGQVLYISKTCLSCENDCKIKSVCKDTEIYCNKFKKVIKSIDK